MKAEIKLITPKLAKELLAMNEGNRKIKKSTGFYASQMLNGEWKENGEPIIIDRNGLLKDGQHRLHAVIEANYSYRAPVISNVDPDVMDTIDTGINRSLTDVLEFNGFKNASATASIIKGIMGYENGTKSYLSDDLNSVSRKDVRTNYVSNKKGLDFAKRNQNNLEKLFAVCNTLYCSQSMKVYKQKEVAIMIYMIAGFNPNEDHITFIKKVLGIIVEEGTVCTWLYKKRFSAYNNGDRISSEWRNASFIKVWNLYVDGDIPITYLKIDTKKKESIKTL